MKTANDWIDELDAVYGVDGDGVEAIQIDAICSALSVAIRKLREVEERQQSTLGLIAAQTATLELMKLRADVAEQGVATWKQYMSPTAKRKYQVELVWNRGFDLVQRGQPYADLDEAIKYARELENMGDGECVKKTRVVDTDQDCKVVWQYGKKV